MSSRGFSYSVRGGTPRFELSVAQDAGQSATSCNFGASWALHKARRVFKLASKAGLLYPSGENPLAELKLRRVRHVERPLPPEASARGRRGAAKPMRWGREKQSEIASCAMGWWRGHRSNTRPVFGLLRARRAARRAVPRGRGQPPPPGRPIAASSVAIVQRPERSVSKTKRSRSTRRSPQSIVWGLPYN
eukprot:COSAG02_NODE_2707_length_8191_cov_16.283984_4_plen_190_part_00